MRKPTVSLLFGLIFFAGNTMSQDTLNFSEQIPILGWYGIPPEETTVARYAEMREAGFTHNFTFFSTADQVATALDTAYAAGMKIIISCGELSSDTENTVRQFMNHPALAGYFLRDEPHRNDFVWLGEWARRIQAVDSTHFCYLNLLPNYATSAQLGTSTYRDYVNTFIIEVPLQILSYDHYPFTSDSVGPFRSGYYENLEIFSDEAQKVGKPFWAFAMATAIYTAYPIPTTAAIRLQMFSNLAYGAQGLQYFTYWTPPCGTECFHDGPIYNGERTEVYNMVKEVSGEIKNLSGVFLGSKVVSVKHIGDNIPQSTKRLLELPSQVKVLETVGIGAVVSILERDSLAFIAVVNRDFQDSMKLVIKGDSTVNRVLKDGTIVPANISNLTTIGAGPGDIAVFMWGKEDSLVFEPLKKLKVHLPLDYDLKDVSGNNYDAADAGTAPVIFLSDEERGRVAFFEKNAHAMLPVVDELKFGTGDFSYSFWIKCSSVSGTPVILGNKDFSSEVNKGFALSLKNRNNWVANLADGSGNKLEWAASDNGTASLADDQWHMVAVSFERNGKMDVYLDGKLMPSSPSMDICPGEVHDDENSFPITLMQDGTGTRSDDLSGYLDDIRIWNRAMSADEFSLIYSSDTIDKSREIVYLPLDTDLKDASGRGFDATDAGTVATTFINDPERGRVAYFDRLSHAVLPKVDALRFGERDFSFSLWIKCSPASYTPLLVCNKNWSALGASRKKGFALYTNESNKSSGQRWSVNFGDGESEEGGSGNGFRWNATDNRVPTIADEQWHFIAVSFDRDKTMDVYLDGKLMPGAMSMAVLPGNAHDDVNDYPITLMQDGTGKFFMDIPASLDEFRIWGRPLKSSEVASLYNYGLTTATEDVPALEGSSLDMKVYPNPAKGILYIDFNAEGFENTILQVYSTTGILMKNISIASQPGLNKTTFDMGGWTPGIYLVRLVAGKKSETVRMMVTK